MATKTKKRRHPARHQSTHKHPVGTGHLSEEPNINKQPTAELSQAISQLQTFSNHLKRTLKTMNQTVTRFTLRIAKKLKFGLDSCGKQRCHGGENDKQQPPHRSNKKH